MSFGSSLLGRWACWRWEEIRKIRNPGCLLTASSHPVSLCRTLRVMEQVIPAPAIRGGLPEKGAPMSAAMKGNSDHPLQLDKGMNKGLAQGMQCVHSANVSEVPAVGQALSQDGPGRY